MPIDHENHLIFVHIPKCAGTSIEVAFGWANQYSKIGSEETRTAPNFDSYFGGGLQHLTIREIIENGIDIKGYRKFAIMRNPFDRIASHFLWRHYRFKQINRSIKELKIEFSSYVSLLANASSQLSVFENPRAGYNGHVLPVGEDFDEDMIRHIIPQTSYLYYNDLLKVDRIFDFEHISKDNDLVSLMPQVQSLEVRMKGNARFPYADLYDEVSRLVVSDLYKYDIYSYNFVKKNWVKRFYTVRSIYDNVFLSKFTNNNTAKKAINYLQSSLTSLPRKIWMYWHQGWEQAPFVVRECLKSWMVRNPGWELVMIDRNTLSTYIELPLYIKDLSDMPHASFSDIVRIVLLEKYGGVWIDASVYCERPLNQWIDRVAQEGFFAFERPTPERPVASWFLAAHKGNYIIRRWKEETLLFWKTGDFANKTKDLWATWNQDLGNEIYFWFHMIFKRLLEYDSIFRESFALVPKVSADGPHEIQSNGLLNAPSDALKVRIMTKAVPVYKLTCQIPDNVNFCGSALDLLFERTHLLARL